MSKNTKERILCAARALFNEHGYTQVGMRAIAKETNISLGNLTYHYPLKDDIVWALYLEFSSQTENQLKLNEEEAIASAVLNALLDYYKAVFEYRFFALELPYFIKHYEAIRVQYQEMARLKKKQLLDLLFRLRSQGLMFHETVDGYDQLLTEQWFLHSNFWLAQQTLAKPDLDPSTIEKGVEDLFHLLLPQMTLIGKKRFREALKELGSTLLL
ncbi:MAG: TetR/AcrR family transcriptional regulator [Schleiferiaceae bacterium]|jgi:AcrR family transcriptional regulator|nr:TetR/AcrR family transcriptional regulator [Schleiferiaceae bacterium]